MIPLRALPPPSVSVVFPMYNEEAYIQRAVGAARSALEALRADWEIVVVDDASTDRTPELADALAREDPRVRVVHNETNRKLGGTLRRGYQLVTKDLVLYSDADLPFDFGEVARAIRLLEFQQAEVLAAYRFDRTSEGLLRTFYTLAYSALVRTLFRLRLRDINFSFKLFRRSLLERIELEERGQLHRRRVPPAGAPGGGPHHPDGGGLLPARARGLEPGLAGRDRGYPSGDGAPLARASLAVVVPRRRAW